MKNMNLLKKLKELWNKKTVQYTEWHEYPHRFSIVVVIAAIPAFVGIFLFWINPSNWFNSGCLVVVGLLIVIFAVLFLNVVSKPRIILVKKVDERAGVKIVYYRYEKDGMKESFEGLDEAFARVDSYLTNIPIPKEEE